MHSGPMQSDDDEEIRRNSTLRRVRLILLTLKQDTHVHYNTNIGRKQNTTLGNPKKGA